MTLFQRFWTVVAAIAICAPLASAADDGAEKAKPEVKEVELFQAMKDGLVKVKMIQRDPSEARFIVKNETKEPLRLAMPETFAGVPVVGQFDDFGGGGGFDDFGGGLGDSGYGDSGSSRSSNDRYQSTGGGFGGGRGGYGGGGGYGGFGSGGWGWSIPAEGEVARNVNTVCLEYGDADPKPSIPYAIRPLETVTKRPGVKEVCEALGKGKVPQEVAQLSAWNLANGVPFELLDAKRVKYLDGRPGEKAYHPAMVRDAARFADLCLNVAKKRAEEAKKTQKSSTGSMADEG